VLNDAGFSAEEDPVITKPTTFQSKQGWKKTSVFKEILRFLGF